MLHHLPRRPVRRVAQVADEATVPAGTVVMRQGERAGTAYLVGGGFLDVVVDGRPTSPSGCAGRPDVP